MEPSESVEAEASALTVSGSLPLEGVTVSAATGGWAPCTVITVEPEPDSALLAVKVTVYVPWLPAGGVQLSVPVVLPAPGVKVAPDGKPAAASEEIASASGYVAVTLTVSRPPTAPLTVPGAVTRGARSTLETVMLVLLEPDKALLAVKVTV